MSRVVFILGAGASKEAGAPLMNDFLDVAERLHQTGGSGSSTRDFALVLKALAQLQVAQAKASLDLDNLESVFAAFEMAALCGRLPGVEDDLKGLSDALRRVIARTLDQRIKYPIRGTNIYDRVHPPRPYDDFVRIVQDFLRDEQSPRNNVSFITFNYDLALDYALYYAKVSFDYCLGPPALSAQVDLMKLHGSLNWVACGDEKSCPGAGVDAWELGEFLEASPLPLFADRSNGHLKVLDALPRFRPHGGDAVVAPFIVPPTWSKSQYHARIATVWQRAAAHFGDAEHIFVIGFSLPESDMFFRDLFALGTIGAARLKHFLVIDPDQSGDVARRFKGMLGRSAAGRFRPIPRTFSEGLGELEAVLKTIREDGRGA